MAIIYNSEVSKELIDGANIQTSKDLVPNQLADKVVPVMEVNPKLLRIANLADYTHSGTSAASMTISGGSTSYKILIQSISLTMIKDAACDAASGVLTVTMAVGGVQRALATLPILTLTAQQNTVNLVFQYPVEADLGSSVSFNMPTFAAGNCRVACSVTGFKNYNFR
jgi:hypothetical protein